MLTYSHSAALYDCQEGNEILLLSVLLIEAKCIYDSAEVPIEVGYDEYSRFEGFSLTGDCVAGNQEVNTTTRYSKKTSAVPLDRSKRLPLFAY